MAPLQCCEDCLYHRCDDESMCRCPQMCTADEPPEHCQAREEATDAAYDELIGGPG